MSKLKIVLTIIPLVLLTFTQAYASTPGTWSPAGNMATARARHTATLLANGKILVAGGNARAGSSIVTLSSAELYDPNTNTWSPAGTMSTPRSRHTVTLLSNGKVLVAGGRASDFGPTLATAELYDPVTGSWTPTGSMTVSRDNFPATRLSSGQVLVSGGVTGDRGDAVEKSAEVYDPQTGNWNTVDKMANTRFGHQSTLLADGRVLVTGGANSGGHCVYTNTAEIYDPVANKWSNVDPMGTPRGFHLATALEDGRVVVTGGWTLPACLIEATAATEIFDPSTGRWSPTGNMTTSRAPLVLTSSDGLLTDGRVLVTGGKAGAALITTATAEVYNPNTGVWSLTGSMAAARQGHTTTRLNNGQMLVVGGGNNTGTLASAEVYTP